MKALLEDLLPPKARQSLYLFLTVGSLAYGVLEASGGNWMVFVGGMFTSLTGLLAAGNVDTAPKHLEV